MIAQFLLSPEPLLTTMLMMMISTLKVYHHHQTIKEEETLLGWNRRLFFFFFLARRRSSSSSATDWKCFSEMGREKGVVNTFQRIALWRSLSTFQRDLATLFLFGWSAHLFAVEFSPIYGTSPYFTPLRQKEKRNDFGLLMKLLLLLVSSFFFCFFSFLLCVVILEIGDCVCVAIIQMDRLGLYCVPLFALSFFFFAPTLLVHLPLTFKRRSTQQSAVKKHIFNILQSENVKEKKKKNFVLTKSQ